MSIRSKNLQKGQVMLTIVVFFLSLSTVIVLGIANPVLKQVRISKDLIKSKTSYFAAEGSIEDFIYRLNTNKQVPASEVLTLAGASITTTVTNTATGKQIIALATVNNHVRKMQADIELGNGIAFHYGVQSGEGGFVLQNSSTITGNVFSNGPIVGGGNYIYGDIVSSGPSGLIDGIHATGTAWAHNIRETGSPTIIDKDAYYVSKDSGVAVTGVSHPGNPDQNSIPLPISDDQISEWKTEAASGGNATCSSGKYTISSNITIGPKKIPCDLEISGTPTVTLNGHLWVTGDITIQNSAILRVSSSLGNASVAIIADNPSNRTSSSKIDLKNSVQFFGSGSVNSFIFLVSQNNSAESGGSEYAIEMDNSATGKVVLYAGHGLININNSASLKEVTAYKIVLKNSANITYDTGLPSVLFESGPAGGYDVTTWKEIE